MHDTDADCKSFWAAMPHLLALVRCCVLSVVPAHLGSPACFAADERLCASSHQVAVCRVQVYILLQQAECINMASSQP